MKRELIENVKVQPYTSAAVIDRAGFLSAIFAAKTSAAGTVTIALSHCDTSDGAFTDVDDDFAIRGDNGVTAASGDLVNIDLDLVGCKRFIKITVSSASGAATATYALALGDPAVAPV